jgi:hypothetical protein
LGILRAMAYTALACAFDYLPLQQVPASPRAIRDS